MRTFIGNLKATAVGYKTYIVGAFFVAYAATSYLGIDPPAPGDTADQSGAVGLLIILLRSITTGPPASLRKGSV